MITIIVSIACLPVLCLAYPYDQDHLSTSQQAWKDYKLQFDKIYTDEEVDAMKYVTWKHNMAAIELHNIQYGHIYIQGPGMFTDMTDEEFNAGPWITGLVIPEEIRNETVRGTLFEASNVSTPKEIDWRDRGYVTPVKNQGACGSCYAFAATGALEGQWFKKTGRLIGLSEQQIVDCPSSRYGMQGCHGGWAQAAFNYLKDCGGSMSDRSYRYTPRQGWCMFNKDFVSARVTGFHDLKQGDEKALTQALGSVGPIAVAIDASGKGFRNYRGGVHYDPYCSSSRLNHAVLVVGYGTENGQDFYLVKNSYGTRYGVSGYIKMARNRQNNCGIANRASYPTVN